MANTNLVSTSVRDINAISTAVYTISRSNVRSLRKQTPFSSKQETSVSEKVTGNPLIWKECQAMQSNTYPSQEDHVLLQVRNPLGISRVAGVLGKNLIHLVQL